MASGVRAPGRLLLAAGLAATMALPAASAIAAAAPAGVGRYVALGDSFASVGTLTNIHLDPVGCARSKDNYPAQLAARLKPKTFVDRTCGAATTPDMTSPQQVPLGVNPPQFDALTPDTDLVTLTIGGNDIGFAEIVLTCATLSITDPGGTPCKKHFTKDGDQIQRRIAELGPKITKVLTGIKAKSPKARIAVVGYLRILPPGKGCWPLVPIAAGDVTYLDQVQSHLNTSIGGWAKTAGATFVNPGLVTGHDVCQLPGTKWVEGLIPTSLSVPVHPNALGQDYVGGLAADALR
ncbi:SGNH/GDSL hydrolase family protein [Crossiella cryophila]|uniref:Lysophospholipase L1-like esterase n=1 Tax=Crossiella cryophila TaxID=43355 RepID=A0A7W7C978_9PSEU|nr:SGNH/GDSL hydrolase family protein [Crossiella cryophila]MBB4675661.1 lysophospholipase L1-like esterase [Crossiella cryophila]